MTHIPVYKTRDGAYTFTDNGTVPTPFHLLQAPKAFRLAEVIPQALRDKFNLTFVDVHGDGSAIMLYQDHTTPICCRFTNPGNRVYYTSGLNALDTLNKKDADASGEISPKDYLREELGMNLTAEQCAANNKRFSELITALQTLNACLCHTETEFILPKENHGMGEAHLTFDGGITIMGDTKPLLLNVLALCDDMEFGVVQGTGTVADSYKDDAPDTPPDTKRHRLSFFVDNCIPFNALHAKG